MYMLIILDDDVGDVLDTEGHDDVNEFDDYILMLI